MPSSLENQFMMAWSTNSSSCPFVSTDWLGAADLLPSNYKMLTSLGSGGFGEVVKCLKRDTKEIVAVKIPQFDCRFDAELTLLKFFKWKEMDKCNIITFIESITLKNNKTALVFEILDTTLYNYFVLQRDFTPLNLQDVRSVVQQLATALNGLKTNQVIHADIKLDNIMLVDRKAKPLEVKLIDFGLAFPTRWAKQGENHQTTHYRAPEILLGLPFSEAIDMWSVGVVMGYILLGDSLFPGLSDYDTMRCIVDLLGVPPDHLLSAGLYSEKYFVKRSSGGWRLKTPREFWGNLKPAGDYRAYHFSSLDDLETWPLVNLNMVEADERKECIDLLKAMLRLDPNERITPGQVLAHPFITRGTLNQSTKANETYRTSATSQPGVISVQPQTACGLPWEEAKESKHKTFSICKAFRAPQALPPEVPTAPQTPSCSLLSESVTCSSGDRESTSETPPGIMLVRPAPAEHCLRLDEDSERSQTCPSDQQEELSESTPVEPPPLLTEDRNMEQEDTELTAATSDGTKPERKEKKKRKKKNCFRRFLAWTKRTFFSCISVEDEG
ncbi:homeodomain-interacting protein kinase 2-like [Plectropomus leopardus]|uniref:homeodomain-interacting protein kinase 2-like n=1 Tax=Plectropomus leopardus TaxID=160734 RepID=UPI001C4D3D2F|nr:homeodomain-interacting protein kinase 2-like [Plectropomus leopardus]